MQPELELKFTSKLIPCLASKPGVPVSLRMRGPQKQSPQTLRVLAALTRCPYAVPCWVLGKLMVPSVLDHLGNGEIQRSHHLLGLPSFICWSWRNHSAMEEAGGAWTSSFPSLPALYLLPRKALFLFSRCAILPLRSPVPVPTCSALAQLDCSRRQLPCVPAPVSKEQSSHRDVTRVHAKGAWVDSGARTAGGRLGLGEGLCSNTLACESERSWPSRLARARWF